mgnify:CR=1 FL=1
MTDERRTPLAAQPEDREDELLDDEERLDAEELDDLEELELRREVRRVMDDILHPQEAVEAPPSVSMEEAIYNLMDHYI